MKNTKWTGGAGTDHWNVRVGHKSSFVFLFVYTRKRCEDNPIQELNLDAADIRGPTPPECFRAAEYGPG